MRARYFGGLVVILAIAGTALAYGLNRGPISVTTATEHTTVETDDCCLTGDCCCPGQGACCDPVRRAKAASSGAKYVKKSGPGCCETGDCCCPGQGACCAVADQDGVKPCCQSRAKN